MIGFMQGRLSPVVDGKIQAFPWKYWKKEFASARRNGFSVMEWTLDYERLYENPLMTYEGREEIKALMKENQIRIPSLTGDCFMQEPFYKFSGIKRAGLIVDFRNIIEACFALGMESILVPLVDNGRLENEEQELNLKKGMESLMPWIQETEMRICFESDFPPRKLAEFIRPFDPKYFGLTYDTGNSAASGFDFEEELDAYGGHICNVHVKDRKRGGATVPLGQGDARLKEVLQALRRQGYDGYYILQTARAQKDNHSEVLRAYRDLVEQILNEREQKEPLSI
jgi:hexulose-6-phosphate isomerase